MGIFEDGNMQVCCADYLSLLGVDHDTSLLSMLDISFVINGFIGWFSSELDWNFTRSENTPMDNRAGILGKLRQRIESEGVGGVASVAAQRFKDEVSLDETHVWSMLDLTREFPVRELPEGTELIRATEAQTELLAGLDTVSPESARERIRGGNALWITLLHGELSFACWIFRDRTPVLSAPGGWMHLPPDIVCLEDSIASPTVRGRGIAPATWSELGLIYREQGIETIITKIRDDNIPSRKAVVKCGFEEIATTRYRRKGLNRYATAKHGEGRAAEWISSQLVP